jgi:hypothetical protein
MFRRRKPLSAAEQCRNRTGEEATSMGKYSLQEFVQNTAQEDKGEGAFELENSYTLEVNLNGAVWSKLGSMVAYRGNIKFTREGAFEHGLGKFLKKAVTGEGPQLTKAAPLATSRMGAKTSTC